MGLRIVMPLGSRALCDIACPGSPRADPVSLYRDETVLLLSTYRSGSWLLRPMTVAGQPGNFTRFSTRIDISIAARPDIAPIGDRPARYFRRGLWQGSGVPNRADLDKQPGDVAGMFDDVARRYDLMNDLMTFGQVRFWRKAVLAAIAPQPG